MADWHGEGALRTDHAAIIAGTGIDAAADDGELAVQARNGRKRQIGFRGGKRVCGRERQVGRLCGAEPAQQHCERGNSRSAAKQHTLVP